VERHRVRKSLAASAAIALAVGLAASCTGRPPRDEGARAQGTSVEGAAPEPGTIDEVPLPSRVATNPSAWIGRHVTVRGGVLRLVGEAGFAIVDPGRALERPWGQGAAAGSSTDASEPPVVLVLSPALPVVGAAVSVSGTVRTFTSETDMQAEAGWLRSAAGLDAYRNRPVILADSVRTAEGHELVPEGTLPAGTGEPR
jgi:hypothetical protein